MVEVHGVAPGALTPLGIISDHDGLVTVVVDSVLLGSKPDKFPSVGEYGKHRHIAQRIVRVHPILRASPAARRT